MSGQAFDPILNGSKGKVIGLVGRPCRGRASLSGEPRQGASVSRAAEMHKAGAWLGRDRSSSRGKRHSAAAVFTATRRVWAIAHQASATANTAHKAMAAVALVNAVAGRTPE
jgi:hypothetical protein